MAHAERCPVCGGAGRIPDTNASGTTAHDGMHSCHGCAGAGWVTVKDEGETYPSMDAAPAALHKSDLAALREQYLDVEARMFLAHSSPVSGDWGRTDEYNYNIEQATLTAARALVAALDAKEASDVRT